MLETIEFRKNIYRGAVSFKAVEMNNRLWRIWHLHKEKLKEKNIFCYKEKEEWILLKKEKFNRYDENIDYRYNYLIHGNIRQKKTEFLSIIDYNVNLGKRIYIVTPFKSIFYNLKKKYNDNIKIIEYEELKSVYKEVISPKNFIFFEYIEILLTFDSIIFSEIFNLLTHTQTNYLATSHYLIGIETKFDILILNLFHKVLSPKLDESILIKFQERKKTFKNILKTLSTFQNCFNIIVLTKEGKYINKTFEFTNKQFLCCFWQKQNYYILSDSANIHTKQYDLIFLLDDTKIEGEYCYECNMKLNNNFVYNVKLVE
ncbi:MAG: hypothetical protein N2505_00260 [Endomicrobia bacterium]|nr:hypothetical protein [Endomicrobiia bacterium]